MHYSIIPNAENLPQAEALIEKYGVNLEYNDFFLPSVYVSGDETDRLIGLYRSLRRDRSGDTLHGAFMGLDISSDDPILRERSRSLFTQSMQTAQMLGVKGVVFHTGLAGGLSLRSYADRWLASAEDFLRGLANGFPEIEIYFENTIEQEPYIFEKAAKTLSDVPNFKLCLDYAHAVLTDTPVREWVRTLAPYIGHIHVNDNDLHSDLHLAVGEGKIDFAEFLHLTEEYGLDVSALIEVNDLDKARRSLDFLSNVAPRPPKPQSADVLSKILDVGIALTAERNPDKLLDMIVDTAMSLTDSDGGTLYIPDGDVLRFKISKTRSRGIDLGGNGDSPDIPPVPLCKENICAYSALTGKSMNIADVYSSTEFDFSGPKKYDAMNNYRTRSMVTIPLLNKSGETMGVLQLINAQTNGVVRPFTAQEERIIRSLGSQTAIALSNMEYLRELNEQMWSFTEAMTEAIDRRTPYNASHTRKVAEYCGMIADHINKLYENGEESEFFDEERRDRLIMAALLHDIGKLVIPISVMNKATRLGEKLDTVLGRLREIKLLSEIAFLKGQITEDEYGTVCEHVKECTELVNEVNFLGYLDDENEARLDKAFEYSYNSGGERIRFFTDEEKAMLKIKRGTLTDEERSIMESHALMTENILEKVHFNSSFKDAGRWASQHHELLDGKGYPRGLTADDLCLEIRILTVADICDALLATDRPYKKPLSLEQTFSILHSMADDGKIEPRLVNYLESCLSDKYRTR